MSVSSRSRFSRRALAALAAALALAGLAVAPAAAAAPSSGPSSPVVLTVLADHYYSVVTRAAATVLTVEAASLDGPVTGLADQLVWSSDRGGSFSQAVEAAAGVYQTVYTPGATEYGAHTVTALVAGATAGATVFYAEPPYVYCGEPDNPPIEGCVPWVLPPLFSASSASGVAGSAGASVAAAVMVADKYANAIAGATAEGVTFVSEPAGVVATLVAEGTDGYSYLYSLTAAEPGTYTVTAYFDLDLAVPGTFVVDPYDTEDYPLGTATVTFDAPAKSGLELILESFLGRLQSLLVKLISSLLRF